jgi:hypothetical protein
VALVLGVSLDFAFCPFNTSMTCTRAKGDRRVLWRLNDGAHLDGQTPDWGGLSWGERRPEDLNHRAEVASCAHMR